MEHGQDGKVDVVPCEWGPHSVIETLRRVRVVHLCKVFFMFDPRLLELAEGCDNVVVGEHHTFWQTGCATGEGHRCDIFVHVQGLHAEAS